MKSWKTLKLSKTNIAMSVLIVLFVIVFVMIMTDANAAVVFAFGCEIISLGALVGVLISRLERGKKILFSVLVVIISQIIFIFEMVLRGFYAVRYVSIIIPLVVIGGIILSRWEKKSKIIGCALTVVAYIIVYKSVVFVFTNLYYWPSECLLIDFM